jgi:hypothetical protein
MSVTFSVFPLKKEIPTFREVVELSTKKLNNFLKDYEAELDAKIELRLKDKENDADQILDLNSLAKWDDDFYVWFSVSSFVGGSDSYYWELSDEDKLDNLDDILQGCKSEDRKILAINCLENKLEWNFRRSAGQPAIVSALYGFVASAFTELTDGIIYSSDGGWDYQIFPATAEEFDAVYLRPEKAISEDIRQWSQSYIESLIGLL